MSDPNDPMAEIKASFFIECEELLETAFDGLQLLADGGADTETINAVFRSVHSIKGGAGAFGLDDLVQFAHRYETVLDAVRSGKFDPDPDAVLVFFTCGDILSDLVRTARDGGQPDQEAIDRTLVALDAMVGEDEDDEVTADDFQPMGLGISLDLDLGDEVAPPTDPGFSVNFRPQKRLLSLGNEPAFLFRALAALGDTTVEAHPADVPDLTDLDVDDGQLHWTVTVKGDVSESDIREVFEFVDGLCDLTITPLGTDAPAAELAPLPGLPDPAAPEVEEPAEAVASDKTTEAAPEAPEPAQAAVPAPAKPNTAAPAEAKAAPQAANPTVRVDLDRIDRLVNLVGELVINQAMLSQSVVEAGLPPNSPVVNGLEEFMQLTRDIQDSVMMIRAQPVKSLFQRMSRIVREASAAIGKNVRLVTDGEATEVDKTVIERLADPLTHMIRNAVDHGLESTEDRLAAGKSPEGVVTLRAAHRSGRVVIEVGDDGGGINRPKVFDIAVSKGLIPADSTLTDGEIDNLLFLPGFSTADQISNLSGRGVGMDVVKSAIQSLGGRVSIQSEKAKGTTFSISLPLTLAVLDGMVVHVAGETLVVPLNAIVETLTLTRDDIKALGPQTNVVQIRDDFVPLLDLGAELGYREPLDSYVGGIVLLIAHEDGRRAALVVDMIQDQRQVVIKGLQDSYGSVPGVAAATILGDGQIALILDPVDITNNASGRTAPASPTVSMAG